MFSDERPYNRRRPSGNSPKSGPPVQETTLLRQDILIERKEFSLSLKENPRGRFIRIVEQNGDRFASIIIPASGLKDFQTLVAQMTQAAQDIPPKNENPS